MADRPPPRRVVDRLTVPARQSGRAASAAGSASPCRARPSRPRVCGARSLDILYCQNQPFCCSSETPGFWQSDSVARLTENELLDRALDAVRSMLPEHRLSREQSRPPRQRRSSRPTCGSACAPTPSWYTDRSTTIDWLALRCNLSARQLRDIGNAATSGALRRRAQERKVQLPSGYVDSPSGRRINGWVRTASTVARSAALSLFRGPGRGAGERVGLGCCRR